MTKPKSKPRDAQAAAAPVTIVHDMKGVSVPRRARTVTMAQRDIISEGWQDYVDGRLTVVDIATAAGVSYETTRTILSEMTKLRRVNSTPRLREANRRRMHDKASAEVSRPVGITAPPFSDDWFEQNQKSAERHFKACIVSGNWQFYNAE